MTLQYQQKDFYKINKVMLITLLIIISKCKLGSVLFYGNIYSTATLKCILEKGYTSTAIVSEPNDKGQDPIDILQLFDNAKNAGLETNFIFSPCFGHDSKEEIANILKRVPKQYINGRVWLLIGYFNDQVCAWQNNHISENVKKLQQTIYQFKQQGISSGIITNTELWTDIVDNTQLFSQYPLFWIPSYPDKNPSFQDFLPFGGWLKPSVKMYDDRSVLCGKPISFTYMP